MSFSRTSLSSTASMITREFSTTFVLSDVRVHWRWSKHFEQHRLENPNLHRNAILEILVRGSSSWRMKLKNWIPFFTTNGFLWFLVRNRDRNTTRDNSLSRCKQSSNRVVKTAYTRASSCYPRTSGGRKLRFPRMKVALLRLAFWEPRVFDENHFFRSFRLP